MLDAGMSRIPQPVAPHKEGPADMNMAGGLFDLVCIVLLPSDGKSGLTIIVFLVLRLRLARHWTRLATNLEQDVTARSGCHSR